MKLPMIMILAALAFNTMAQDPATKSEKPGAVALTPPMGWNSYDCYGAAVLESEVKANADYMAQHLKEAGWEYIVVDYCWYYPHPPGSTQDNPPQFRLPRQNAPVPWMPMDEYARLLPDPGKFPSSFHGNGFKALGEYIHSKGLKFGIHLMRGIPRQAVWAKTPIKDAPGIDASMIADTTSTCPWLNLMYGLDMSKPGAQEYLNSLFELYARWEVDFVKVDDMERPAGYSAAEVEGYRKAIEQCGRPMVLSLSPKMGYENHEHMSRWGDMFRISGDFWDRWDRLEAQFARCARWAHVSGPQSWPDADMLPVGNLRLRGPFGEPGMSKYTRDEHYTLFTLWAIFRSPLMLGGNLPDNDEFLQSILTNREVMRVNQECINSREVFNQDGKVIWLADIPNSKEHYLAMFNIGDENQEVTCHFKKFELSSKWKVEDLWKQESIGTRSKQISADLPPHGAVLYKLNK